MGIKDYTFFASLGHRCSSTFQLRRFAEMGSISRECIGGPFDWVGADLDEIRGVIEDDFEGFLNPSTTKIDVHSPDHPYWLLTDASGNCARHHLPRRPGSSPYDVELWFRLGKVMGKRISSWRRAFKDPNARLLLVRADDYFKSGSRHSVDNFAEWICGRAAGKISLVWVRYDETSEPARHPAVMEFTVRRPWTTPVGPHEVDMQWDYGLGTAWRGVNQDWDRVWQQVFNVSQ